MAFGLSRIKNMLTPSGDDGAGVVGIDIGSSSIKVVQLKRVHNNPTLETYGELQLGPYANLEIGSAANLEAPRLTEALVDIVREASVTSKNAALAIPYTSSFVTVIDFPKARREQLSSMVPIEARKYVPVPINEVTLDWFVIPGPEGTSGLRVLLAAIHNEALTKFRSVVRDAALLTSSSEIEIFSTIRSGVLQEDTQVMLLDLGAASTKLYVVNNGIVERTHTIASGAQDLTRSLAQAQGISQAEAEELKRQVGLRGTNDADGVNGALTPTLDRIFREARLVLTQHEERSGTEIEKIVLSGGGSTLQGIEEYGGTLFEKSLSRAQPFEKVEYPAFLQDTLMEVGPSFSVAIGAALRLLNEQK